MNKNDSDTATVFFMWLIVIVISIVPGIFAWNFVDPESFLGGVCFIIMWVVFSYITRILVFTVGASIVHIGSRSEPTEPTYRVPQSTQLESDERKKLAAAIKRTNPFANMQADTTPTGPIEPSIPTEWILIDGKINDVRFGITGMAELIRRYGEPGETHEHSPFTYALVYPKIIFISDTRSKVVGTIIATDTSVLFESNGHKGRLLYDKPIKIVRLMEHFSLTMAVSQDEALLAAALNYKGDIPYFEFSKDRGDETEHIIFYMGKEQLIDYPLSLSMIEVIEFYTVANS